jgi:hypothetical protein
MNLPFGIRILRARPEPTPELLPYTGEMDDAHLWVRRDVESIPQGASCRQTGRHTFEAVWPGFMRCSGCGHIQIGS